jgi:ribose 5-phosphate isomerase B
VKIALGCDHRGYRHKERLAAALAAAGHAVEDCGCAGPDSSDYPDAAFAVAERVRDRCADRGILICGSGIGMSIAANKVLGVRAALCADVRAARMTREHNDSNVLCLSGDALAPELVEAIAEVWLATEFAGGRHGRRVDKISAYEREHRR